MAVTEYWKHIASELVLKNQGSAVSESYVGLGAESLFQEGNPITGEISGTGYTRIPVTWTDFVDDMSNMGNIVWQVGGTWSEVHFAFISDSSQGGQILFWDTVGPFNTSSGDVISIVVGDLVLT